MLKFLEGRKENRVWYTGSYHALGVSVRVRIRIRILHKTIGIINIVNRFCVVFEQIVDDTYASQMQRLLGNALHEKDLEAPRSITEARSILSRDTTNRIDSSSYIYF